MIDYDVLIAFALGAAQGTVVGYWVIPRVVDYYRRAVARIQPARPPRRRDR